MNYWNLGKARLLLYKIQQIFYLSISIYIQSNTLWGGGGGGVFSFPRKSADLDEIPYVY